MTLRLGCEGCGRLIPVREELVGKRIRCPHCGQGQRAQPPGDLTREASADKKEKSEPGFPASWAGVVFVYLSLADRLVQGNGMVAWYAGAMLGVLGFVGFVLCIVGVFKGQGTACGVFGILGFIAKAALILVGH
jgi:hypothetical protein